MVLHKFTLSLMLLCCGLFAQAQTGANDPNFQPGSGANGLVYASVVQPDNKIIIVGSFTSYNGSVCNRVARLNPNGSLDPTFASGPGLGPNGDVYTCALLANGKILIGGSFNSVSSTSHINIALLSANGSIETGYQAEMGGAVQKIVIQPDGNVVIGGDFTSHKPYTGGPLTSINRIVRLIPDGNLDPTFTTNIGTGANASVRALAVQSDGKLLIGGNFTSLNGSAINRINRLNSDGTVDPTFSSTGANNWVVDIKLQADNKILLAGDFTAVNGTLANRFVRLTSTGTTDGIFNDCNATVRTISVLPNGKIFLGGNFNLNPTYNAIRVVRLNTDLSYDASFGVPAANASVFTSNLLSDGRIFIGGDFTVYSGQSRTRVALIQNCEGFSLSAASASPTVCNSTAIPTITHTVTGFQSTTGIGTPTGLPAGVTATYSGGVISINGTPTSNGPFNYSIPMTGACQVTSATGTIIVNGNMSISGLMGSSGPMSDPAVCINTSLPVMAFNCTNSTGIGTPTGLPAGVSAAWVSGQISITGTPTQSGVFNYSIPAVGACGSATAIGTITVNDTPTAATPSSSGPFCPNVAISPITISTSGSVNSIGALNGAPSGLSASYSNGVITITGTPAFNPGTWNYSIQMIGSCGNAFATGSIEITEPTSAVAPLFQASYVCQGSPMITRKHPTYSNANLVDIAAATGLPPGCTATWSNDTIYISGTPTTAGSFNYMIPVYSDCNSEMALGTINVSDLPAEFFGPNATPTVCQNTPIDPITHPLTNITTIVSTTGLPAGVTAVLNPNVLSISGTPTVSGVFNYTIIGSSSCGTDTTYGTITVNPATVTVGAASATPFVCVDEMMATISHTCSGANAIGTITGLPNGLITNLTGNTLSIAGTPSEVGTFNYNIALTGTCGSANATGTIGVLSSTNCTQGVEEANLINFAFAPNPTCEKVTFTFDGVSSATIEMIDLNGKLISKTTEVHSGDTLSVDTFENGVYLIRILTEKGNYTQRLVKQ